MAAQYDELGNYLGDWETEEERKKREEELANTAVRTQEIKTYGDGTVERITKEEMPGEGVMAPAIQPVAVQPAVPVQPVQRTAVSQPVAPVAPDTFARMQQAESGNRDFDAQGRPITSPAGALYRNQVMPSTAANPGYGIRPAQSQTPEEYNRVGQEYFQALLKQFNGDEQKAVAAYNAGPGRVQQNIAANQGQLNVAQLPRETQAYMNKVMGGAGPAQTPAAPAMGPVAPGAEVAAPAQAPGAPLMAAPASQPAPNSFDEFGTPIYSEKQATLDKYTGALQQGQGNLGALDAIRSDTNAPEWIRAAAGEQAYDLMSQEVKKKQAQQQAKDLAGAAALGDRKAANTIAKELQSQEGSWLKMILLGFISPTLAGEEAIKLGFGNKWITGTDAEGKQALLQVNAKGLPLKGYTADGNEIASNALVAYTTGGAKVTTSGTFFQAPSGQILRAQSDEQGRTRLVDAASGARYTGPTSGLTKLEEAGAIRKMDRGLVIDLAKKHGNNVLDAEKEYVSINGPFKSPEERQQFRQAYGYDLAQPAAVPGVAGFPGAAPAQAPAAPAATAPGVTGPVSPAQVPSAAQAPAPGAPVRPVAPGAVPSGVTQPIAGMQTGVAVQKQQQLDFQKYGAEDITPKADAGSQVARIRKEQIKGPDGILANPEIAGILQGGKGSEVYNIFRDLATGSFKDQADLSARVESLGLDPRQKEILYRQINLATQVSPLTLKANAGAGSVSDAEQKANKAANIDITRQPLYAGLADLGRSQHVNDMSVARADFKAANPQLVTTEQFNSAWNAEKARRQKEYDQIFEARAKYIEDQRKKGKDPAGAVIDAFKYYPTPEWNAEKRSWDLGTDFARKAARPRLSEFNR